VSVLLNDRQLQLLGVCTFKKHFVHGRGIRISNHRLSNPTLIRLKIALLDCDNHTPSKFPQAHIQIFARLPAEMTSLTLTSLPFIDKALLNTIAGMFVYLTELHLCTLGRLKCDDHPIAEDCRGERQRLLSVKHSHS